MGRMPDLGPEWQTRSYDFDRDYKRNDETTERTMGGRAATEGFFRMFMIPGARHCRGGDGPYSVDFLAYIEDWVEHGKAPTVLIGSHPNDTGGIAFTRPIYPYPLQARYKGSGDSQDAANFKAVDSR
jgi:hypothetical protein